MSRILHLELPDTLYGAIVEQAAAEGIQPEVVAIRAINTHVQSETPPQSGQDQSTFRQMFGVAERAKTDGGSRDLTSEQQALAQQRFEQRFGAWDLGHPLSLDNEQIDADLASEYGRGLDPA